MPHLRIRALNDSAIKALSMTLPKEMAKILNTPEDNFTVEKIPTTFYRKGEIMSEAQADPMIEIFWFDRGLDIRDEAAKKVTELVRQYSDSQYIAVVFVNCPKDNYYENGVHF